MQRACGPLGADTGVSQAEISCRHSHDHGHPMRLAERHDLRDPSSLRPEVHPHGLPDPLLHLCDHRIRSAQVNRRRVSGDLYGDSTLPHAKPALALEEDLHSRPGVSEGSGALHRSGHDSDELLLPLGLDADHRPGLEAGRLRAAGASQ